jgi:hypothetical protein
LQANFSDLVLDTLVRDVLDPLALPTLRHAISHSRHTVRAVDYVDFFGLQNG